MWAGSDGCQERGLAQQMSMNVNIMTERSLTSSSPVRSLSAFHSSSVTSSSTVITAFLTLLSACLRSSSSFFSLSAISAKCASPSSESALRPISRVDRLVDTLDVADAASSPSESLDRFDARGWAAFRLVAVGLSPFAVEEPLLRGAGDEAAKWSSPSCARRAAFSAMTRWRSFSLQESGQDGSDGRKGMADYSFSSDMTGIRGIDLVAARGTPNREEDKEICVEANETLKFGPRDFDRSVASRHSAVYHFKAFHLFMCHVHEPAHGPLHRMYFCSVTPLISCPSAGSQSSPAR